MLWRWHAIETLLRREHLPSLGAEVGVKEGRFIGHMLEVFPKLTMYAIDPWEQQPGGNEDYLEWDFNDIYQGYKKRTELYADRVLEIREYSNTAVNKVEDFSLDFVFIDAQHDYDSVKEDIELWYPKVKPGGLFAGHDYNKTKFSGVVQAVDEFFIPFGGKPQLAADTVWYGWI